MIGCQKEANIVPVISNKTSKYSVIENRLQEVKNIKDSYYNKFSNDFKIVLQSNSTTKSQTTVNQLNITPQWEYIQTDYLENVSVIPIKWTGSFPKNVHNHLVMLSRKIGTDYEFSLLALEADSSHFLLEPEKIINDFSGIAFKITMEGQIGNAIGFQNGVPEGIILIHEDNIHSNQIGDPRCPGETTFFRRLFSFIGNKVVKLCSDIGDFFSEGGSGPGGVQTGGNSITDWYVPFIFFGDPFINLEGTLSNNASGQGGVPGDGSSVDAGRDRINFMSARDSIIAAERLLTIIESHSLNDEEWGRLVSKFSILHENCLFKSMVKYLRQNNHKLSSISIDPNIPGHGSYLHQTKEIKFLDSNFAIDVVLEELFHFYQDHYYPNGFSAFSSSPYTGKSNIEWEAHFSGFIQLMNLEIGTISPVEDDDYLNFLIFCNTYFGNDFDLFPNGLSTNTAFISGYFNFMNSFINNYPQYNFPIDGSLYPNSFFYLIEECN